MQSDRMNIVFAADEAFIQHLAVAILSILKNSLKDDKFKFYILSNDISERSKNWLLSLKKVKFFDMEFVKIDTDEFQRFPVRFHLKIQAYFRLKIPALIKESKVLYLDSDILVKKSLRKFYESDISDKIAMVVEDLYLGKSAGQSKNAQILGVNNYFNSGVILWNLDKTRESDISKKCYDFILNNPEKILLADQDALNFVLQDSVKYCDKIYNFQFKLTNAFSKKMYLAYKKDIVIMHFVADVKPWHLNRKSNWRFIFEYYMFLLCTPWRQTLIPSVKAYYMKRLKYTYKYIFMTE